MCTAVRYRWCIVNPGISPLGEATKAGEPVTRYERARILLLYLLAAKKATMYRISYILNLLFFTLRRLHFRAMKATLYQSLGMKRFIYISSLVLVLLYKCIPSSCLYAYFFITAYLTFCLIYYNTCVFDFGGMFFQLE